MVEGHPRINIDPKIMVGQPCIKGTRITVKHIMNELAIGMSPDEIVSQYPHLTVEDVQAAMTYAAREK
ncbi:MAG TPA: DUF433 domain-containing protein [Rhizomicrobium sp.]|jgi:uncharacterized protein (DUF433 family)